PRPTPRPYPTLFRSPVPEQVQAGLVGGACADGLGHAVLAPQAQGGEMVQGGTETGAPDDRDHTVDVMAWWRVSVIAQWRCRRGQVSAVVRRSSGEMVGRGAVPGSASSAWVCSPAVCNVSRCLR